MNLMKIKIFRPDNYTTLADEVYNKVKHYYFLDDAKMLKIRHIDELEDTVDVFISLDRIGQITVENIKSGSIILAIKTNGLMNELIRSKSIIFRR